MMDVWRHDKQGQNAQLKGTANRCNAGGGMHYISMWRWVPAMCVALACDGWFVVIHWGHCIVTHHNTQPQGSVPLTHAPPAP